MKRVIVLGTLGMAGHVMAEYLDRTNSFQIFGVARTSGRYVDREMDVTDFSGLEAFLNETKPDYVINCIGILVNRSSQDICNAILVNSYLPNFLSRLAATTNFKLVHISTDCVFSGDTGQYHESDFKDGRDLYAKTKALGEIENNRDLTIRTSIIGPELKGHGTGLLDWAFKQRQEIRGYTKAYWSGVTTLELAKATHALILQKVNGLVHLCPVKKISKYDLLKLISAEWKLNLQIHSSNEYVVDKSLVCSRTDFKYTVPNYSEMLDSLHEWMQARPNYYSHYNLPHA